jgi:hypothetical protein
MIPQSIDMKSVGDRPKLLLFRELQPTRGLKPPTYCLICPSAVSRDSIAVKN